MDAERSALLRRAHMHGALADPQRLAIVEELLLGDRSPSWFSHHWGVASNLIAHHTRVLADAGLVDRRASEADRRRRYLHLTPAGRRLAGPAAVSEARRVVFVCTHNSARSQFAATLWRGASDIPAASGGTAPAARVHPMARRVARRHGLDLPGAPRRVPADLLPGALIVTVCDHADGITEPPHRHWSIPDPVADGKEAAFAAAWDDIADRVAALAATLQEEQA